MPAAISAITPVSGVESLRPSAGVAKPGEFQKLLEGTIQGLQTVQTEAATSVQKFLTGETDELHSTVMATQKAEIAFELGLQVRNKVVSAYQEIMRMQM